jgi:hypothetical protein
MHYQDLKHLHILAPAEFTTYRKTHPYTYPDGGSSLVFTEISFWQQFCVFMQCNAATFLQNSVNVHF